MATLMGDEGSGPFVVRSGWVRKVLSAVLMIGCALLFSGLGVIFVVAGMMYGGVGIVLGALSGLALGLLAVWFLMMLAPLRSEIVVGARDVRLVLNRQRGLIPLFAYDRATVPFEEVAAVEKRDEFFSVIGMASQLVTYSLVTRDGRRYRLGSESPQGGMNLPYSKAAETIAERAGVPVRDLGGVRGGGIVRTLREGLPAWGTEQMTVPEVARARSMATFAWQIALTMVVVTVALRSCTGG